MKHATIARLFYVSYFFAKLYFLLIFHIFFLRVNEWRDNQIFHLQCAHTILHFHLTMHDKYSFFYCILFASYLISHILQHSAMLWWTQTCLSVYIVSIYVPLRFFHLPFARRFVSALFSRHGTFQPLTPYTRFSDTHGMLNSQVSLLFYYCYYFYIGCITYTEIACI